MKAPGRKRLMGMGSRPMESHEAGQSVVVDSKHGRPKSVLAELRHPDSHGRLQMRETMRRHGADGAICVVPREVQEHRAVFEVVRASMRREGMSLWAGLPHEGAIRAAMELARGSPAWTTSAGRGRAR